MRLSLFFPRGDAAEIPWGLDQQKSLTPEIYQNTLKQDGTLDTLDWNSRRNSVLIIKHVQGIFDTHLWES